MEYLGVDFDVELNKGKRGVDLEINKTRNQKQKL